MSHNRYTAKKIDELFALHSRIHKHSSDTRLLHDTNIIVHTISMIHKQLSPVPKYSPRPLQSFLTVCLPQPLHITQFGFPYCQAPHSLRDRANSLNEQRECLTVRISHRLHVSQFDFHIVRMSHSLAFTQFPYLRLLIVCEIEQTV